MQSLKKFYFGKQKVKVPNTFIGGIGGTINTTALLAAKLGIDENRIKLFKVTGVDVECAIIGGSYKVTGFDWSKTMCSYYIDSDNLVNSVIGTAFWSNTLLSGKVEFKNATTVGVSAIADTPNVTEIILPKATSVEDNAFSNYYGKSVYNLKRIYIPLCTILGTRVLNNNVFNGLKLPLLIYCNPFLQTNNAGGEDGDIVYARSIGATILYVTNFTPPNTITNLSTGTIYNTAVQLNFTPPTSVNGVDFYEVYINGERFSTREIKNSGGFITGLTPSTNYNIRIVAVDMFYNKSELSNTVNVSTTNRVATDVDAISYINASSNTIFQDIIDDMFIGFKTQGLYAKTPAFYPFLGTTAAQHKWNAKNPLDTNAAFRLQFFGGGTHSNLGYQCNGTNAYANTFFAINLNANINSFGATIVCGTNNANYGTDVTNMGSTNPASATNMFRFTVRQNNTNKMSYFCSYNQANGAFFTNNVDCRGVFTGLRNSISENKLFINKTLKASGTGGGTAPTGGIYIGASNQGSSPFGYSNQRIQFTAIHEGLTDSEVIALHTIIDNFESAIGRKTW